MLLGILLVGTGDQANVCNGFKRHNKYLKRYSLRLLSDEPLDSILECVLVYQKG